MFFGFHDGMLVAVHAMMKKTQKTPTEDLALARQRLKELQSWQGKTRTSVRASRVGSKTTGIREEVTAAAIKAVIARQLASEMKKKKITKQRMAELMKTSRAQVHRLLDPDNGSATIESLQRAAKIVGRELRLQLV